MLSTIRDNAQGIVMWIIIGLVILAMAGFVLPSYFSGGAGVQLATVNGVEIKNRDLTRAVQQRKDELRKQLGQYYNENLISDDMLRAESLRTLVNRELFKQFIDESNLQVSNQQIVNKIASYPEFQDANGKFSARKYKAVIRQQGMNEAGFEMNVAKDVASEAFNTGVFFSAFVTDKQVDMFNALMSQQRKAGLLRFELAKYKQQTSFPEEKISAYYELNKSRYKTDASVSVQYLDLDLNKAAESVEVEYKDIAKYYDSHIKDYSEKNYPAALRIALDLKHRIEKGESFAELAKKYSRDAASANNGGELGFVSKGMLPKPFEDAVFKMKKGELSEPIKTKAGYHVVKLIEIDNDRRKIKHIQITPPAKVKNLADVKDEIKKELQLKVAEESFFENVDKVQNAIYENQDSLDAAAQAAGAELKNTALFTRKTVPAVLNNPAVVNAIFSDEVLTQGKNSEAIQLSDTHYIVVRANEYNPPGQKPLESVKADIINDLGAQTRTELIEKDVSAALLEIKQGKSVDEVLRQFPFARWQQYDFVSRNNKADKKGPSAAVARKLFSMRVPVKMEGQTQIKPSIDLVTLENKDQGILIFSAVRQDPANKITEAAKRQAARRLYDLYSNAEFIGFEKLLSNSGDVVINLEKQTAQ